MRPLAGEGLGLSVRESSSQRYVMIHISSYYVCVVYSLPNSCEHRSTYCTHVTHSLEGCTICRMVKAKQWQ